MRLDEIFEPIIVEASWRYSSFAFRSWYNPQTKEFVKIPLENMMTHAKMVKIHPEIFGVEPSAVENLEYSRTFDGEAPFNKLAFANGWIRVASQDRNNPQKILLLQGNELRPLQRLAKLFWYDFDGKIGTLIVKHNVGHTTVEYPMDNEQTKIFVMRGELPAEKFAVPD